MAENINFDTDEARVEREEGVFEGQHSSLSNSVNPFQNFESEISDEQLLTWQQMNAQVRELVQQTGDEGQETLTEMGDVFIDTNLLVGSSDIMNVDLSVSQSPQKPSSSGTSVSQTSALPMIQLQSGHIVGTDITLQYLSGKMSFSEFSDLMEQGVVDAMSGEAGGAAEDDVPPVDAQDPDYVPADERKQAEKKSSKKGKEPLKKKQRKRIQDLPQHLKSDMGEVSLTFARGDHDEAIKMCMEIIRQAPKATKPFQTLGMLYEDIGDMERSFQFYLIAAYMDPRDVEEWARLADVALELKHINQAIKCISQAIKYSKGNKKLEYMWERAHLYETVEDFKKALEGYQAILPLLPDTETDQYFKLAWSITRSCYETGDKTKAVETMRKAFRDHPQQITSEDVNLLLELQIPEKVYLESIEVLVKHCGVVLVFPGGRVWSSDKPLANTDIKDGSLIPISCTVPDILPIDLRVKLAVCMIHQKYIKVVKPVIQPLFEEAIEENGDLYLDVAEAYMDQGYYQQARQILGLLVKAKNYDLAAVWLRYGECLKFLGDLSGAVAAYTRVVQLAPSHIGARMSLSALQQQRGKHVEALEALEHGDQVETKLSKEEQQLLIQKCHLLKSQGKVEEVMENVKKLLFQEWREVDSYEMSLLHSVKTFKHRKENLITHLERIGKDVTRFESYRKIRREGKTKEHGLSLDDMWEVFNDLCEMLAEAGRYSEMEEVALLGLLCPRFQEDPKAVKDVEFMCLVGGLLAKNPANCYTFARSFLLDDMSSNQAWNLFLQVVMVCNDIRHNRFCLRRMLLHPDCHALGIMNGHNSMVSGSYKHSLGEYANAFHRTPTDPMLSLLIGLDFLHISTQRFAAKRHYLVTQGLVFLNNYMELRGPCQETYYNMARALHQLSILYAAVHFYKKVLETPPSLGEKNGSFDLTREAAYNLALIYQRSGSTEYARHLLSRYCVL